MLTVKQIFELACNGVLDQHNFAIKYGNFSEAKRALQIAKEIQCVIDNLDKKENYIASSNPATETAVLFALNLKEGQVQQPKAPQKLYQVRITHLDGHEQILRFPILPAAMATFELMKYELEVGRIRRAVVVETIFSVGYKKELYHIGETEEEDIF